MRADNRMCRRKPKLAALPECYIDVLDLSELMQFLQALFTADTRELVAAKGRTGQVN